MREHRNKKENGKCRKIERLKSEVRKQECNRGYAPVGYSILSLSTAHSLARLNGFENKSFRPILSKWVISMVGFSCEIAHIEEWFPSWT